MFKKKMITKSQTWLKLDHESHIKKHSLNKSNFKGDNTFLVSKYRYEDTSTSIKIHVYKTENSQRNIAHQNDNTP